VGTIRVLVCDDVAAFRALMRYTLQEDPEIEVVGEAADGLAAVEAAGELQPDVALSGFGADRMAEAAIAEGAFSYLEKTDNVQSVRDAVHAAAAAA
jgi:chemotaxis response regulator CheB